MTKVLCVSLDGLIQSNQYKTPKGNTYLFHKGHPTDVPDKDDVDFFLMCGDGKLFRKVGVVEQAKKKVAVSKKPKIPLFVEDVPSPDYPWTEEELFGLNRMRQVQLIKACGKDISRVPRFEKDRVSLILELLKEKSEEA